MKKIALFYCLFLAMLCISCSNNDETVYINEDSKTVLDIAEAHNSTIEVFFKESKNTNYDNKFSSYIATRSSNENDQKYSDRILLEDIDLTMELVNTMISCIPGEQDVSYELKEKVKKSIHSYLLRAKEISKSSDKEVYEILLELADKEYIISPTDKDFLLLSTKARSIKNDNRNPSKIQTIYLNILDKSNTFWTEKNTNLTRSADSNFAYEAFYDAVGGGIGACLGSGLLLLGNYLFGTALSTVFSYAADLSLR